jgi:hypothetical protein
MKIIKKIFELFKKPNKEQILEVKIEPESKPHISEEELLKDIRNSVYPRVFTDNFEGASPFIRVVYSERYIITTNPVTGSSWESSSTLRRLILDPTIYEIFEGDDPRNDY